MRFDKPPAFMISPASTKNGIASREKLSAPFTSVCAMIWTSNMSSQNINAAPHNNSAQAIGKPIAIPPNRQPRKISTAMIKLLAVATLENCYA
ncbi:hypothetical protein VEE32_28810 [Escherichia coli]|nr:hypothetical protein VEE32_28810 [Escherichia coli]